MQAGRAGRSIVGVAAALPCPPLADAHAAAAAADARANGVPAENGFAERRGPGERGSLPFTQRHTAEWSPCIPAGGALQVLARKHRWRAHYHAAVTGRHAIWCLLRFGHPELAVAFDSRHRRTAVMASHFRYLL